MKKTMKKNAMLLFGLASSMSFAQIDFSSTRFGVIAGPTYSKVQHVHSPSSPRISFYGGAFALIPIGWYDMYYIQPQIEYLSGGENGENGSVYASNYFSIPVYFKAYFSEAESEFFGQIGPRFGFLVNQVVKNPSRPIYAIDQKGKASNVDIAISAGLGYSYRRNLEFLIRYDYGFTDNLPGLTGTESRSSNTRQQIMTAGISYIFD